VDFCLTEFVFVYDTDKLQKKQIQTQSKLNVSLFFCKKTVTILCSLKSF